MTVLPEPILEASRAVMRLLADGELVKRGNVVLADEIVLAVLRAMREPTDEMSRAASDLPGWDTIHGPSTETQWRAMIDAVIGRESEYRRNGESE